MRISLFVSNTKREIMSVVLGGNYPSTKATEENRVKGIKSSKSSISHKNVQQENPGTHLGKQMAPTLTTSARAPRQALGNLSNTAHQTPSAKPKRVVTTKKEPPTLLQPPPLKIDEERSIAAKISSLTEEETFPEIEYMPVHTREEKEDKPYQPPAYFKGLIELVLRPSPIRYRTESDTLKDIEKHTFDTTTRPSAFPSEAAGLFCQPDIGDIEDFTVDLSFELPDLDDLKL